MKHIMKSTPYRVAWDGFFKVFKEIKEDQELIQKTKREDYPLLIGSLKTPMGAEFLEDA